MIAKIYEHYIDLIEDITPDTQRTPRDVFRHDFDLVEKMETPDESCHRHFVLRPESHRQTWEHGDPTPGIRYFVWQWSLTVVYMTGVGSRRQAMMQAMMQDVDKIAWTLTSMHPDNRPAAEAYGAVRDLVITDTGMSEIAPGVWTAEIAFETTHWRQWS
jgi:hypothetical protein